MCGIAGLYRHSLESNLHEKNRVPVQLLRHRGPDAFGQYEDERVSIYHHRLKIIDLSDSANQPLWSKDRRYCIVYNGEIFNFKEIRKELARTGYSFVTQSDTEVLLYSYIHWGQECMQKLDGEFAFAIYDRQTQKLILARDHVGIKPLYYYSDENIFYFSSEMRGFSALLRDKTIHPPHLINYLRLTYFPYNTTIYREVHKLLPGHWIEVGPQGICINRWYTHSSYPPATITFRQARQQWVKLLHESVQRRLTADVPLGVYLSGGIDSAVIASIAREYAPEIKAYTIGFKNNTYVDESFYAAATAKCLGISHKVFDLDLSDLREAAIAFLQHLDEPFADSSAILTFWMSKKVKEEVSCVLSGDGADELLAGYRKHRALYLYQRYPCFFSLASVFAFLLHPLPKGRYNRWSDTVRQTERLLKKFSPFLQEAYSMLTEFHSTEEILSLSGWALREAVGNSYQTYPVNNLNDILIADQMLVLPGDMLKKVDFTSMAHGVEVRVPFLAKNIIEFVNRLPAAYKWDFWGRGKHLLKASFADKVPSLIMKKRKTGFEIPLHEIIQYLYQEGYVEAVMQHSMVISQYFDIKRIKEKIEAMNAYSHASASLLWSLIVLASWENNEKKNQNTENH